MPTTPSLRATLEELVALKDLQDQFDERKQNVEDFASAAILEGIQAEYLRRKPLAWAAARTALAAGAAEPVKAPQESAKVRFDKFMQGIDESPIERLRFFCSLAMCGQDWLDVEPFFDAVIAAYAAPVDPSAASMERPAASGSEQP